MAVICNKVSIADLGSNPTHILILIFFGLEKLANVENVDDYGADRKPITLYLAIFYCFKFIRS